ncbi:hypothetical protein FQA39_LY10672 [Lamprigera yunnana]|nr:hypothetical protein FQA39_LY10672 [Lamprigera yunnana]
MEAMGKQQKKNNIIIKGYDLKKKEEINKVKKLISETLKRAGDEGILEEFEGENDDEPCYGRRCTANEHCCPGSVCVDVDGVVGTCLFAYGRRAGELCRRDSDCESGLLCAESETGGSTRVCRPPVRQDKQYSETCNMSSECDISRGLCCQLQRRHRQAPRKCCIQLAKEQIIKYSDPKYNINDLKTGDCETMLLNQTIYYLNKSKSKWISIGLYYPFKFASVVKIFGRSKQYVIFKEEEWIQFHEQRENINKYFQTFDTMWKPRQIGSKTLTFEMIEEKKILKIEDMSGNEVYLGWEFVSEVWSLESVLRYRLSYSSERLYEELGALEFDADHEAIYGMERYYTVQQCEELRDKYKIGRKVCRKFLQGKTCSQCLVKRITEIRLRNFLDTINKYIKDCSDSSSSDEEIFKAVEQSGEETTEEEE